MLYHKVLVNYTKTCIHVLHIRKILYVSLRVTFLIHLKSLGDLLQSTYVGLCSSSVVNNTHVFEFSSESTGQIFMKLGHNDHLGVRIRYSTLKRILPPRGLSGGTKWDQISSALVIINLYL